jgi:uncharacterized membrane protein
MHDPLRTAMSQPQRVFNVVCVSVIFIFGLLISIAVPPFQSPDEFEHITRAALLGNGDIVLRAPAGNSSGGMIDSGLAQYMASYAKIPFNPDTKLSSKDITESKSIRWSGVQVFRPALGMAYYFPAIYAIHTLGLKLGEWSGFSIDASYKLSRLLLLIVICFILFYSFEIYQPPIIVLALLVIPMSLFQFASASLDGIATAVAIFIISLFCSVVIANKPVSLRLFYFMIFAWILVASSRLQLFSMILLPLLLGYITKRHSYIVLAGVAALAVIGWQIVILKTIVDGRVALGASSGDILAFYLLDPAKLIEVLHATLTNTIFLKGYFSSFFGVLGWLDTPFKGAEYKYLFLTTVFLATLSIDYKGLSKHIASRISLLISGLGAVATSMFAMLVTWTPHPAVYIEGVQGRYFLIPALLVGYALSSHTLWSDRPKLQKLGFASLLLFALYSVTNTLHVLIDRYYVQAN